MKAEEFLKTAAEKYREQVTGAGVQVDVPELGIAFFVFPAQPEEIAYIYKETASLVYDHVFAIKLICGRAKTEEGHSKFDSQKERDKAEHMLMSKSPPEFTGDVARRVIDDITSAFDVTSIEDAEKNSEATES